MLYIDNEQLKASKNGCSDYALISYSNQNVDFITRHYV